MLETIVSIQPKDTGGGSGETRESVVYRLADDMLEKLPEDYVPHQVKERLRKMGHLQPLNIFLRQEIDRMQRVISTVRNTLTDLKLAIDGTIIMSENLRDALDNMFDARIPNTWKKVINVFSYTSEHPQQVLHIPHGLFRQNLCGNGTVAGADTVPKYRYRSWSHISCSVKVRHNIQ